MFFVYLIDLQYKKRYGQLHLKVTKNFNRQIRKPKLSDLELIAIDLTAEYMGIDSECHLFRLLPKKLSFKIDRTVYIRRRKLFADKIRLQHNMSKILNADESYFIVDSMPLEGYKMSRCRRSKICTEQDYSSPNIRILYISINALLWL